MADNPSSQQPEPLSPNALFSAMDPRLKKAKAPQEIAAANKIIFRRHNIQNVALPANKEKLAGLEDKHYQNAEERARVADDLERHNWDIADRKDKLTALDQAVDFYQAGEKAAREAMAANQARADEYKIDGLDFGNQRAKIPGPEKINEDNLEGLYQQALAILTKISIDEATGKIRPSVYDDQVPASVGEFWFKRLGLEEFDLRKTKKTPIPPEQLLNPRFWKELSGVSALEMAARDKAAANLVAANEELGKAALENEEKLAASRRQKNQLSAPLKAEIKKLENEGKVLVQKEQGLDKNLQTIDQQVLEVKADIARLEQELADLVAGREPGAAPTPSEKITPVLPPRTEPIAAFQSIQSVLTRLRRRLRTAFAAPAVAKGAGEPAAFVRNLPTGKFSEAVQSGVSVGKTGWRAARETGQEVVKAAGRRVVNKAASGLARTAAKLGAKKAAGWLSSVAASAAAGGAVGTAGTPVGTVIGFLAGLAAGLAIASWNKIKKALKVAAVVSLAAFWAMVGRVLAELAKVGQAVATTAKVAKAVFDQTAAGQAIKSLELLPKAGEAASGLVSKGQIAVKQGLTALQQSEFFTNLGATAGPHLTAAGNAAISTVNLSAISANVSSFLTTVLAPGALAPGTVMVTGVLAAGLGATLFFQAAVANFLTYVFAVPADPAYSYGYAYGFGWSPQPPAPVPPAGGLDSMGAPEYFTLTKEAVPQQLSNYDPIAEPGSIDYKRRVTYRVVITPLAGSQVKVVTAAETVKLYRSVVTMPPCPEYLLTGPGGASGCDLTAAANFPLRVSQELTAGRVINQTTAIEYQFTLPNTQNSSVFDNSVLVNTVSLTAQILDSSGTPLSTIPETKTYQATVVIGTAPDSQPYQFPLSGQITTLDDEWLQSPTSGSYYQHCGIMYPSDRNCLRGGIDIASSGQVVSTLNGTVDFAGWLDGIGGAVFVVSDNHLFRAGFLHMKDNAGDLKVATGDRVTRGQVLGEVYVCPSSNPCDPGGMANVFKLPVTKSSGTHLHYQVLYLPSANLDFGDPSNSGLCSNALKIERVPQDKAFPAEQYRAGDCP